MVERSDWAIEAPRAYAESQDVCSAHSVRQANGVSARRLRDNQE